MRLKWGKPKNPGKLVFSHSGYWHILNGVERWVNYKSISSYSIRWWKGIVVGNLFIGLIKVEKDP